MTSYMCMCMYESVCMYVYDMRCVLMNKLVVRRGRRGKRLYRVDVMCIIIKKSNNVMYKKV